jgi:hypothetical protein
MRECHYHFTRGEERSVRSITALAGLTVLTAAALIAHPTAGAQPPTPNPNNPALNGRYQATINGEWATTNQVFHDEATIQDVWTITSSCENPQDCTGTVVSDQGWTANIAYTSGDRWRLDRELPNWEPCYDGTAATAVQKFLFWQSRADGTIDRNSPVLTGWQETTGPSGACGRSKNLVIRTPFKLSPLA